MVAVVESLSPVSGTAALQASLSTWDFPGKKTEALGNGREESFDRREAADPGLKNS